METKQDAIISFLQTQEKFTIIVEKCNSSDTTLKANVASILLAYDIVPSGDIIEMLLYKNQVEQTLSDDHLDVIINAINAL